MNSKTCRACNEIKEIKNFKEYKYKNRTLYLHKCLDCESQNNPISTQYERDLKSGQKICNKCKLKKNIIEFNFHKSQSSFYYVCKTCQSILSSKYRYYEPVNRITQLEKDINRGNKKCTECHIIKNLNSFSFHKSKNRYFSKCRKCLIEREKQRILKRGPEWKEKRRLWHLNYLKTKLKTNVKFKISEIISNGIRVVLKHNKNYKKWQLLVEYNEFELKVSLESKFTDGMNWDKYLNGEIVIDHLFPRELFNYSTHTDKEFKMCWCLDNLRPEWRVKNNEKSDFLHDGRRARNLSELEKKEYIKNNIPWYNKF